MTRLCRLPCSSLTFVLAAAISLAGCGEQPSAGTATQPTDGSTAKVEQESRYEASHRTLLERVDAGREVHAETAHEADQEPGPDDDDGFCYLTYGNGSWCVTVDYEDPIPADVKVAFRTDQETHRYRLEKGGDLVSQRMIEYLERH